MSIGASGGEVDCDAGGRHTALAGHGDNEGGCASGDEGAGRYRGQERATVGYVTTVSRFSASYWQPVVWPLASVSLVLFPLAS